MREIHKCTVLNCNQIASCYEGEKSDGTLPIPNMYNIEDSRHWYNKCDVGMVVHRIGDSTILRVLKSRYHEILGTTGQVKFRFNPTTGRYNEEEESH